MVVAAALSIGTVGVGCSVMGCEDPNDPSSHVEKLDDPIRRGPAITRLKKFYSDAMATDQNNRDGEKVKSVRDKIIEPLAKLILDGTLDNQLTEKSEVIGILADARDERGLPALAKVLNDYKPDDKRPEDYDTKIGEVVLQLGEMVKAGKLKGNNEINNALFGLFKRTEANTLKAQHKGFYRMVNNVLISISEPSWEGDLIGMLDAPIKTADPKAQRSLMDQVYWQTTACEILGRLKSKNAVKPLMKVVLSPLKGHIQGTASAALVKIGQPALEAGIKLLNGEDEELKTYAKDEFLRADADAIAISGEKPDDKAKEATAKQAANAYLDNAVMIVGNMGTKDAVAPMLKLMNAESTSKETKATIGSQLHVMPLDNDLKEAFKKVYTAAGVSDKLPNGDYAKEALINSGILFFDREMNGFMFEDAINLKDDNAEAVVGVQATVLDAAIRSATADQWHYVDKLKEKVLKEIKQAEGKQKFFIKDANKPAEEQGPFTDKEIVQKILKFELKAGMAAEAPEKKEDAKSYEQLDNFGAFAAALQQAQYLNAAANGKKVLDECKESIDCYLKKLTDPETDKLETAMIGAKSAFMIGILGDESVKMKLVDLLPKISSGGIRATIGRIVVTKSPNGDEAVVNALSKWIDDAEQSRDSARIDVVKSYKQILPVLEGRKQ